MGKIRNCPICGSGFIHCPECGKKYTHGNAHHCQNPECQKINAPLDCKCGRVVSQSLDGVLDFDMMLIVYK